MQIRGNLSNGKTYLEFHDNSKGKGDPLAIYEDDRPIEQISKEELVSIVNGKRKEAMEKYMQRMGVRGYTLKGED